MAKKGKSRSELGRKIGRFFEFVGRRWPRYANRNSGDNGEGRPLSSPVRFIFIVVALPVLIMFLLLLTYALLVDGDLEHLKYAVDPLSRFKALILGYQTFVIFISSSMVAIQLMAIFGALFNWTTVLFAYVVITGLMGTVVGVVGIFGIIISCLLMNHKSTSDHSILITSLIVIAFILTFYLLTILGLKLMSYMRRRAGSPGSRFDQEYGGRRSKRPYRSSPVARRGHKRSSYKSIDAITSPFNNEEDDQELSAVYVEGQGPSLKTLLPLSPGSPPSSSSGNSSSVTRTSFTFQI